MVHRRPTDSLSAALFAAALFTFGPAPAPASAQDGSNPPPLIRVEGNRFVGPEGQTLMFRGFSFSDPDNLEREGQWNRALFEVELNPWSGTWD